MYRSSCVLVYTGFCNSHQRTQKMCIPCLARIHEVDIRNGIVNVNPHHGHCTTARLTLRPSLDSRKTSSIRRCSVFCWILRAMAAGSHASNPSNPTINTPGNNLRSSVGRQLKLCHLNEAALIHLKEALTSWPRISDGHHWHIKNAFEKCSIDASIWGRVIHP